MPLSASPLLHDLLPSPTHFAVVSPPREDTPAIYSSCLKLPCTDAPVDMGAPVSSKRSNCVNLDEDARKLRFTIYISCKSSFPDLAKVCRRTLPLIPFLLISCIQKIPTSFTYVECILYFDLTGNLVFSLVSQNHLSSTGVEAEYGHMQ